MDLGIGVSQSLRDVSLDDARAQMPFRIALPGWTPAGFALQPIARVTDPGDATFNCPDDMRELLGAMLGHTAALTWSRDDRGSFLVEYARVPNPHMSPPPNGSIDMSMAMPPPAFIMNGDTRIELPDELQPREESIEVNGAPARLLRTPAMNLEDAGPRPADRADALSIEWERDGVRYTVREFRSGLAPDALIRIAASIE
jgi:hypothetical protein